MIALARPEASTADPAQRRLILQQGEFHHNGVAGDNVALFRQRDYSLALSVLLAQKFKSQGLGSVGSALTFHGKEFAWAFTAVGFLPEDKEGRLTQCSGDGYLVGVDGAVQLDKWPAPATDKEGAVYKTYWLPPDNTLPIWRKLGPYFPEGDWRPAVQEMTATLYTAHKDHVSTHWIALGGA